MEITVLNIQNLRNLQKEVKDISELIEEITSPYKSLQQTTNWLDQQETYHDISIFEKIDLVYKNFTQSLYNDRCNNLV